LEARIQRGEWGLLFADPGTDTFRSSSWCCGGASVRSPPWRGRSSNHAIADRMFSIGHAW